MPVEVYTLVMVGNSYLLVSGEPEGEFRSFVEKHLAENLYLSIETLRDVFVATPEFEDIEFCLCVVDKEVLYALVGGGATLSLIRDNKTTPLLKTLKATASLVTGNVHPGDSFEMATTETKHIFTLEHPEVAAKSSEGLRGKTAGLIDKLLVRLPERKITVHGANERSGKKASLIGLALLAVLGISVYLGLGRRAESMKIALYEPVLVSAIHDFEEARGLAEISQSRARELILRAHQNAKELESSGVKDPRLTELKANIAGYLGKIAGIYEEPARTFFDLTIVASGFEASDVALSGGKLRILNSSGRRLAGLDIEGKRTEIIAGPDYLSDALATAAYENRSFILSSDGIREVTKEVELVVKPDWKASDILFEAFAGNLYVLDRGNNQIWRYQGVVGGFLEKKPWLGEGFTKNVTDAVALAIDGSIWTINTSGEFKVYSMGAPATFAVSGNPQPFSQVEDLYTSDKSNFVYVLDKGNSRISTISKRGEYVGEYTAPELSNATRLVVDEEHKLLLFLAESKLFAIEAKHLNEDN